MINLYIVQKSDNVRLPHLFQSLDNEKMRGNYILHNQKHSNLVSVYQTLEEYK